MRRPCDLFIIFYLVFNDLSIISTAIFFDACVRGYLLIHTANIYRSLCKIAMCNNYNISPYKRTIYFVDNHAIKQ